MKVSHATMRGLQASRLFIKKNVERFIQASQEEKDAVLQTMEAVQEETLRFEVSGNLILHPYLRDCNLNVERLVEALTQMPTGRNFDAGTVELAGVAEALRKGRIKLDRLNAEIEQKKAELRVIKKTIQELQPQVVDRQVELDVNTVLTVDEDIPALVDKYSAATEETLCNAIQMSDSERTRGALTFIGQSLMELELPMESSIAFLNGYHAAEEYCE